MSTDTNIVLTHGYFLNEDEKELKIMRPYPTLGILYVSAYLKQHGHSVKIVDSTFSDTPSWKVEILACKPKIMAFYANLMTKVKVLELVKFVREMLPDTHIIAGGPDVTYNAENYLNAGFDFVVSGEGEQTMYELCTALLNGTQTDSIPGVSFLSNGDLVQLPSRQKIKELKELPFPDRAGISMENYLQTWQHYHGKRTLNISTQRGCPYTCKWCSTAVYGQSYRRNTPARVVEEILHLKAAYNIEALWFVDDVFTVSHKWIQELHAEFIKHDLYMPFECITRAERLNDEMLERLQQMGCFRIWIGAESGSQKVIDLMDRRVSLDTVKQMIRRTQDFGMEAGTFIMVGYPGEQFSDILLTSQYLRDCVPNLLTITRAYPIKGTGLYEEVITSTTETPEWTTSTDREIKFQTPYSDRFYRYAIRYLMNSWQAKRSGSVTQQWKSKIALTLMKLTK